jgi:hypothetical protein
MEMYIISAVVGLAYLLNGKPTAKVPKSDEPNGQSPFFSNRVQEIRLNEQAMSDTQL